MNQTNASASNSEDPASVISGDVISVSVIIVSRHRAALLPRCLASLAQQDHPALELIVVADPQGIAAAEATGLAAKRLAFDQANISAARNKGLSLAAGAVVAFIDDDAVAEPTWLSRLSAPFADPDVVAATGFVRGRNGISYQWRASEVDSHAQDHPLPDIGATYSGTEERAVKTQGTNCAFRSTALRQVGGFDPAYRFFLDEADVNLRLAPLGKTAVVPGAEVVHGYAASARRRTDRVPLSLHEIAASTAVFLRRHAGPAHLERGWLRLQGEQAARVAGLLAGKRIDAAAQATLMTSLAMGWAEGLARPLPTLLAMPDSAAPFQPLAGTGPRPGRIFAGRLWQRRRLMAKAAAFVVEGGVATVLCFSLTPRAHRVSFGADGVWLQEGGVFGRSQRAGPRLRFARFATRVAEEIARIADCRPTAD